MAAGFRAGLRRWIGWLWRLDFLGPRGAARSGRATCSGRSGAGRARGRRERAGRTLTLERCEAREVFASDLGEFSIWQNPATAADVVPDGIVAPADLLRVANALATGGERTLTGSPFDTFDSERDDPSTFSYLDVTGDGRLDRNDFVAVLEVLEELNAAGGAVDSAAELIALGGALNSSGGLAFDASSASAGNSASAATLASAETFPGGGATSSAEMFDLGGAAMSSVMTTSGTSSSGAVSSSSVSASDTTASGGASTTSSAASPLTSSATGTSSSSSTTTTTAATSTGGTTGLSPDVTLSIDVSTGVGSLGGPGGLPGGGATWDIGGDGPGVAMQCINVPLTAAPVPSFIMDVNGVVRPMNWRPGWIPFDDLANENVVFDDFDSPYISPATWYTYTDDNNKVAPRFVDVAGVDDTHFAWLENVGYRVYYVATHLATLSNTTPVPQAETWEHSVTITTGTSITTTVSTQVSAEFGAQLDVIAAKLQAITSGTVSLSDHQESSETDTLKINETVPPCSVVGLYKMTLVYEVQWDYALMSDTVFGPMYGYEREMGRMVNLSKFDAGHRSMFASGQLVPVNPAPANPPALNDPPVVPATPPDLTL